MKKTFRIQLPLSAKESFEILRKSGDAIVSWRMVNSDFYHGFIAWKQSFWSLTGSASIVAKIDQQRIDRTTVTVEIHKPLQLIDPVNICGRVFHKLDKTLQDEMARSNTEHK